MALLRYSGGKARLVKKIISHITVGTTGTYVEPFVGGGSVALAVAARYPYARIILNDLDPAIHAFWNFIANGSLMNFAALLRRVQTCQPTIGQFHEIGSNTPTSDVDRAFQTLFLNRTSFVSSNGKRPLGGWNQGEDGDIDSRWNSERLSAELLEARRLLSGRTVVLNKDFEKVIAGAQKDWSMYLDPPYFKAGNQLYNFPWDDADHVRLCELLKSTCAEWVLSYDFHPRIVELYSGFTRSYPMPATYSISKRSEVEGLFTPVAKDMISDRGYVAPRDFPEFFERYPDYVRLFVERKMHWSRKRKALEEENTYSIFDALIDDYTQELLLFLSALPGTSKYRAMGFTDPIQLFNPGLWGGVSQQRFHAYIRMILSNKFQTMHTRHHHDGFENNEARCGLGAATGVALEFDETRPDLETYRNFVVTECPVLLPTFDSFFDWDSRHDIKGYETKRVRLISHLQNWFVHGKKTQRRKEYKKRVRPNQI